MTAKKTSCTAYTAKETFYAYLITAWFSFGVYLFYLIIAPPYGKSSLPELFLLVLLSCFMVFCFPLVGVVGNVINGVAALQNQDYTQGAISFGLVLAILLAWYIIRHALYGAEHGRWKVTSTP